MSCGLVGTNHDIIAICVHIFHSYYLQMTIYLEANTTIVYLVLASGEA